MSSILAWVYLYASLYNLDPKLVTAIIHVESRFNTKAVSHRGAVGLMQVMPKMAHKTKRQLQDPETNIREGVRLLSKIKEECRHQVDFTYVICYNLGSPKANKVRYPKKFIYYKQVMEVYRNAKDKTLQNVQYFGQTTR